MLLTKSVQAAKEKVMMTFFRQQSLFNFRAMRNNTKTKITFYLSNTHFKL